MSTNVSASRPSGNGRHCTRSGCSELAISTLTYIYADSTAVLGPLSTFAEPHAFDLCLLHRERLKVPNGWKVIEHDSSNLSSEPTSDDLRAIADAIRQVATSELPKRVSQSEIGRRGHLRAIPNQE